MKLFQPGGCMPTVPDSKLSLKKPVDVEPPVPAVPVAPPAPAVPPPPPPRPAVPPPPVPPRPPLVPAAPLPALPVVPAAPLPVPAVPVVPAVPPDVPAAPVPLEPPAQAASRAQKDATAQSEIRKLRMLRAPRRGADGRLYLKTAPPMADIR